MAGVRLNICLNYQGTPSVASFEAIDILSSSVLIQLALHVLSHGSICSSGNGMLKKVIDAPNLKAFGKDCFGYLSELLVRFNCSSGLSRLELVFPEKNLPITRQQGYPVQSTQAYPSYQVQGPAMQQSALCPPLAPYNPDPPCAQVLGPTYASQAPPQSLQMDQRMPPSLTQETMKEKPLETKMAGIIKKDSDVELKRSLDKIRELGSKGKNFDCDGDLWRPKSGRESRHVRIDDRRSNERSSSERRERSRESRSSRPSRYRDAKDETFRYLDSRSKAIKDEVVARAATMLLESEEDESQLICDCYEPKHAHHESSRRRD